MAAGAVDVLLLLARVLVAGFGAVLTAVSLRSWSRYREARFLLLTLALFLFAAEGTLVTFNALSPGTDLPVEDALVVTALVQLILLYLAIVRRR